MLSKSPLFLLDSFSAEKLELWEKQKDKILRHYWDLYNDLAFQRHKMADSLRTALLESSIGPYEFNGWQRQVRYKYSLSPLSPKGSLIEPGGRFNIPDVNPEQIPPFPALYIAEDKETTLQEAGQQNHNRGVLSALDLALIKKDSISIISVRGKLESVIDLHNAKKLEPFLKIIKNFTISKNIIKEAQKIGLDRPQKIKKLSTLIESLLDPNWRAQSMQFDIPANCQIFGQLVLNAGIGGILYPSKFTKKRCLAVYPQNFDLESFIAVEGDIPEGVAISKLDVNTWPLLKTSL